ncbi:RHS repeat-associated core domain-containing protein [Flavobacterium sediminilitoris]|uniref:RHS repeat-associated core domain-containing protein n=1 Tax=Flavobacterium sediminilitoris TaxID=2024526 RepID=A0ABY4HP51_9FLAO|nr:MULTISPECIES: DUF6443 domain-containing protein [Flavobacterium]UOX34450.1 RHS repeat-associated core domain-containing protein [Flavobacterium sediminilitoris]
MKKIIYLLTLIPFLALGQSPDQNWVKTITYKQPTTTPIPDPDVSVANVQVSYFDGLGRPIQQVAHQQSNSGKDIITHIEYDEFGRQTKEYLPFPNQTASLNYVNSTTTLTELNTFYSTYNGGTTNPYSEKELEASPLNRVFKQAAPGDPWAMGQGKEIKLEYDTNLANDVRSYQANATWNAALGLYTISIQDLGYYAPAQLYVTITKDENWTSGKNNTTEEYKDKEGQVVLKRTFNNNTPHETYYIYDQFGNLTYVIPPLAEGIASQANLDNLGYQYKYDHRNRLVEKKLPGKQWEFIIYDKLDRPVATGPAFAPFSGDPNIGWMITKYDLFSRVAYTGWYSATYPNSNGRKQMQDLYNNQSTISESKGNETINYVSTGYTNTTFPTTGFYLLTVNYYDDYAYPNAPNPVPTQVEGQTIASNVKGLPTGSWTRVLTSGGEFKGETSYTLYDDRYRPVRVYTSNHLGGFTQVDSKLDWAGKTEYTVTTHKYDTNATVLTVTDRFSYSPQDRLTQHKQQINSLQEQLIAQNTYDELGQLISKKVGGTNVSPSATGLQKVDYTYNVRGWLKSINDVNDITTENDLFAFKINYNDPENATALFNGNISETFWKTGNDNIARKYSYDYDHLNRLINATYKKGIASLNSYGESQTYDKNGNIQSLQRFGEFDDVDYTLQIDDLAYTYHTENKNQLLKVFDSTNNPRGFKDDGNGIADPTDDYTYDANGNMTKDDNKGITNIIYNHLNLPVKIQFDNGNKIDYIYNATGIKVEKKITKNNTLANQTTYLQGGFQYVGTSLQMFPHAEGYVSVVEINGANRYNYVFNYTDHLGNIRLSYSTDPSTKALEILEENNYYPFGLKHANYNMSRKAYYKSGGDLVLEEPCPSCPIDFKYNYKYNGKELQSELGLNMYDYGARNYDPALGRWMNIDPLAENSRRWTPYNYAYNNPMYFVDPDGMQAEATDPVKKIISLQKTGNVNPIQVNYNSKCLLCGTSQKTITPTSQNSGTGKITEISKMKEAERGFIYDVMTGGGTPEFTLSVTSTEISVNSQYFDSSGNKVDNISDASSLTTTTNTTVTTVNVGIGKVADEASVTKSSTTSTYKVSRKPNSELRRGYSLSDGKTMSTKPTISTAKTSSTSSTLQNVAKQEAKQNFVQGAESVVDEFKKIPGSMDRNFHESLKKL